MYITLLGIIIIVMSAYAFFKDEKLLRYMLVFFSTFTAAAVINIKFIEMPVLTFEFIGAIWLLRVFIDFLKTKPKFNFNKILDKLKENKLAIALIVFLLIATLGELYFLISGNQLEYVNAQDELQVINFSMANINQYLIISFLCVLMITLSYKIKTKEEVKELLKVFSISSIFAVVWGILQFITYYFKIPYPAFLFNNNEFALQCYGQIDNNVKRICSIALEPSTFSINLICFIPFALGAVLKLKESIKSKKYIITFGVLLLTTICAILTTSSTAYVGLVITYGLYGLYILFGFVKNGEMSNRKSNFLKMLAITLLSIAIAGLMCFGLIKIGYKLNAIEIIHTAEPGDKHQTPQKPSSEASKNILDTLKQMTVDKLLSHSGQERLGTEKIAFELLKYSPVIGIGFGTFRTLSLFTNVLLSSGILGLCAFMAIYVIVLINVVKLRKKDEMLSTAFFISIVGTTIGLFLSVPDFVLTFYWIIMVLAYKYSKLEN